MNIPQEAVLAMFEALMGADDTAPPAVRFALLSKNDQATFRHALEAAMPHIRNQIAEEILARVDSPADSEQAELVNVGLRIAANIVEGNDR